MSQVTMPKLFLYSGGMGLLAATTLIFNPSKIIDNVTPDDTKLKYGGYLKSRTHLLPFKRNGIVAGSYAICCILMAYQPDSKTKSLFALACAINLGLLAIDVYYSTLKSEWFLLALALPNSLAFIYYLNKVGFTLNDIKTCFV